MEAIDDCGRVAEIVNEVLPKIEYAEEINEGPCSDFAEHVLSEVVARLPGVEAKVEDYADELALDELESNDIHYYLVAAGHYFDASCPDGVGLPELLPTCERIRKYAQPMGEDLEDEDELELELDF